jgi:hypothetical protein
LFFGGLRLIGNRIVEAATGKISAGKLVYRIAETGDEVVAEEVEEVLDGPFIEKW